MKSRERIWKKWRWMNQEKVAQEFYLGESLQNHVNHGSILVVLPCVSLLCHLFSLGARLGFNGKSFSLSFHLLYRTPDISIMTGQNLPLPIKHDYSNTLNFSMKTDLWEHHPEKCSLWKMGAHDAQILAKKFGAAKIKNRRKQSTTRWEVWAPSVVS